MLLRRVGILGVLMAVLGASSAIALEVPPVAEIVAQKGPGRGGDRWLQQLNLSQDQMQQIQAIRDRYKGQMEQRGQALRQAQQELGNLMAGTASSNDIRDKHRQVEQLRQQLAQMRFESMLEIRDVLSPDQRRQLSQMMQQRRENGPPRPGSGAAPGGGEEPF